MEAFLNRYRNITVLLLVIFAQLLLLAYQVKNDRDVRIIRIWAVTAVTPMARALESIRSGTVQFVENYFLLRGAKEENRRMQAELDRLKLRNQFLETELAAAERNKSLAGFQVRTPSRMAAARVIATEAGSNTKAVFVDRGSIAGVQKGMGVITPDGIVGKVLSSYPTASQVLLITDPGFAAGVISQKHRVRGTLKGQGHGTCRVDYVPNEDKVEPGELFFTSGDDRVFPKGFPVGTVKAVRPGSAFQEISVDPSGLRDGLEEVLIILEGVHQPIPAAQTASSQVYLGPAGGSGETDRKTNELPVKKTDGETGKLSEGAIRPAPLTEADRIREHYKALGAAQGHKFGEGTPGSRPPDFNMQIPPGEAAKPESPRPPVSPPPRPKNLPVSPSQ